MNHEHPRLIAVVSPKGGVGKTTVTANLALKLAASGQSVLVIDLDPQNALRLHLQLPFAEVGGHAVQTLNDEPWSAALCVSPCGVTVLPFGQLDDDAVDRFERRCQDQPAWLAQGLASLKLQPRTWVVIDTPPGSALQVRQLLPQVNALLCVLLPEVASLVTVATMERWLQTYRLGQPDFMLGAYLINAVSDADALETDVIEALKARVGPRLAPCTIRRSHVLRESFASAQPVSEYAPADPVNDDYRVLADWLVAHT